VQSLGGVDPSLHPSRGVDGLSPPDSMTRLQIVAKTADMILAVRLLEYLLHVSSTARRLIGRNFSLARRIMTVTGQKALFSSVALRAAEGIPRRLKRDFC